MAKSSKFGTFGGVFVPSILTILGVIMYLRLPMIIGEAGLWATIGIIIVAHIISVTTGLSVSSIATDKKVEAGGTYYMISRSLGLSIGGTLGLALFVGLSFSVSLYLIGFSESFLSYWGWSTDINNIRLTGTIILLIVTTVTLISTSFAIKMQYFIMVAIVLSLVSILLGDHDFAPSVSAIPVPSSGVSLMVLFGIFFPAVTGFEAGVSMSGDLKDPKKSIPSGSIMAIVVGFVVYIFLAFFFAYTVDSSVLASDSQVLLKIARVPELVIAGIWGATLSSALGSILGAPRILQATAIDKITPNFFAKGSGPSKEPRNALLLTFLIAEAGILIGELDVIARIVSIFFITTYGFLNISAAFERWTSADFRPDFKIPGWVSVVGALACILVMIQLDFVAMLGAVFLLGLIYLLLKRRELTLDSGDAWSSVWASLVKKGLTQLTKDKLHKRNWRPNIIMFSGNPNNREYMVEMGKAISGKLGILSAFELVKSDEKMLAKSITNLEESENSSDYFSHKLPCRDVYEGMDQIARVYGFSGVEPNTILMGWTTQDGNQERFIQLIKGFGHERFNTLFLNYNPGKGYGTYKTIDIWWSGAGRNLSLAFSIVRHLSNSIHWNSTKVRVLIINEENAQSEDIYKKTNAILNDYRLDAQVKVINNEIDAKASHEIIQTESVDTDLVILGIPDQRMKKLDTDFEELNRIVNAVGSSLIINASADFEDLEVIEPKKTAKQQGDLLTTSLILDEMQPFKYQALTDTLRIVETNGQKVLDLFYFKTLHKVFQDHIEVTNALLERTRKIDVELAEIKEIPELLKRKKAIEKLKSDTLFKLKAVFTNELRDQLLIIHYEKLQEGISGYIERLNADFRKYPRTLTIGFDDAAFTFNKEDSFGLQALKRWKKVKHYFAGKPITVTIPYREVARHYQLHSRLVFLERILGRFQQDEELFYKNLRKTGGSITSLLEEVERKIYNEEGWDTEKVQSELEQSLTRKKEELLHISIGYHNRIRVEYRRNVESMGHDMEQLQISQRLAKRSRPKKYYDKLSTSITDFSDNYLLTTRTLLNMISMEIAVNSTRNRQEAIVEDFHARVSQSLKNNYLKRLDLVMGLLDKKAEDSASKMKVELDFDAELYEGLEEHMAKLVMLTEEMPESVEVYALHSSNDEAPETISIPVSRMAEYYVKSRYETPVEDAFEQFIEKLKRSVFTAQDAISLAQFNSENAKENEDVSLLEIAETCKQKLAAETKVVEQFLADFKQSSEDSLESVFEPLSSVKIQDSAMDFSSGLISYQGQQVLTGAGALFEKVYSSAQKVITRLWYSRSETILMSRKLDKSQLLVSINSRLLDLKEKLNPNTAVIQNLPQYYVSLFSGKSNIGKDFWIKRTSEEEAFKKAVKRYKSGFGGGILFLGDRNSGKTAFAKHITQALYKGKNVYSIFPPIAGTTSIAVFTEIFSKALQQRGDLHQMVNRLPQDSVIIINDLELFWTRTEDGMQIVNKLEELIDDLGRRVLFIVNMNPHAYRLISQMNPLGERFIEIISLKLFNAEEIQTLILKRHKSSGLAFGYSEATGQLNEVQMASLFNSYFNYSHGNPGTALNGWVAQIKKVSKGFIEMTKPEYPSLDTLKQLDEDWNMLLIQFVLHKRLTEKKIVQITHWSQAKTMEVVLAMLRAGLIVEKSSTVYHLDSFIHPFVVDALKEKELLR